MIESIVALTILGIYIAAFLAAVLGGLRHEVWQLRNAKTAFHDRYADKITRLRTMAENDLIATIFKSDKLKAVFERRETADISHWSLSEPDRVAMEKEIENISAGLHSVTDSKKLFEGVCSDYYIQVEAIQSFAYSALGWTLVVPAVVIALWVAPDWALFYVGIGAYGFGIVALTWPTNRWKVYVAVRNRRSENENRLISLVDARIFMPIATSASAPPDAPAQVPPSPVAEVHKTNTGSSRPPPFSPRTPP